MILICRFESVKIGSTVGEVCIYVAGGFIRSLENFGNRYAGKQ